MVWIFNIYHKHHHQRTQKKKKPLSSIDYLIYLAVIFGPIMTIPQLSMIWIEGKKESSIVSWGSYLLISCLWLAYGIKHKQKPIIIVQIIWIFLDTLIVIGLLR